MRCSLYLPLLASSVLWLLPGCTPGPSINAEAASADPATSLAALIAEVNAQAPARQQELSAAGWLAFTNPGVDSQRLLAGALHRDLAYRAEILARASSYVDASLDASSKRGLHLLRHGLGPLPPAVPELQAELSSQLVQLQAVFGLAQSCGETERCRGIDAWSGPVGRSRDPASMRQAWVDWHQPARSSRADYQRLVELLNAGAKSHGYRDTGEVWRAAYEMPGVDFALQTERLWSQVQPLYSSLHCYARKRLSAHYGANVVPRHGPIPAHLLGETWQQDWSAIYPLLEPYPGVPGPDIDGGLRKAGLDAPQMVRVAEDFYRSMDLPALPETFWQRSVFARGSEAGRSCQASAWNMDLRGDVRMLMCIEPDAASLRSVFHELGHVYYYLAYRDQPALYQIGAHDGFHEAIGDAILLSLTPEHLAASGLAEANSPSELALINAQMRLALEKIAFLPFGKLVDQWRWGVFDGSIAPGEYTFAWWDLKRRYQGVVAPVPRTEADFDPGAKYHVASNTPYTRYFLGHILQFQIHAALCRHSGHSGPLHQCSVHGSRAAGQHLWQWMALGASQPWQQSLTTLTGAEAIDAAALIEYFQPLAQWLHKHTADQQCGW